MARIDRLTRLRAALSIRAREHITLTASPAPDPGPPSGLPFLDTLDWDIGDDAPFEEVLALLIPCLEEDSVC